MGKVGENGENNQHLLGHHEDDAHEETNGQSCLELNIKKYQTVIQFGGSSVMIYCPTWRMIMVPTTEMTISNKQVQITPNDEA